MRAAALCVACALVLATAACERSQPAPAAKAPAAPHLAAQRQPSAPPAKPAPPPKPAWPFLYANTPSAEGAPFDPDAVTKRNYYFVFDASGSMGERKCAGGDRKITVAKRALLQFAQNIPRDANLGGLAFNQRGVQPLIPIGPLDPAQLRRAVGALAAGGDTPLAQAIREAYAALTRRAVTQLGYGEYHLVVITDGEATGEDPRNVVDRLLAESPVVLHTIGFCIGDRHSLNQPGRTIYLAADSPEALDKAFAEVLAEAPKFTVSKFK
jgi:hypothetical protein